MYLDQFALARPLGTTLSRVPLNCLREGLLVLQLQPLRRRLLNVSPS